MTTKVYTTQKGELAYRPERLARLFEPALSVWTFLVFAFLAVTKYKRAVVR